MSPIAKTAVERRLMAAEGALDALSRASAPWRHWMLRHFGHDPDEPANSLHAEQWASPAIRHVGERLSPFEIDGDYYTVNLVLLWARIPRPIS